MVCLDSRMLLSSRKTRLHYLYPVPGNFINKKCQISFPDTGKAHFPFFTTKDFIIPRNFSLSQIIFQFHGIIQRTPRPREKAKFAFRAKITALHHQLAFEGKGVWVKSVVTLRGADTSPQQTKTGNIVFWRMG